MTELVTDGPLILGFFAAALAGLISFASPCVVPLVPGYMSYLASIVGGSVNIVDGRAVINKKTHVAAAALLFVLGFTTIFLLATVSIFGAINTITLNATLLQKIGGIITILMGLTFMGALPWLQNPTRIAPKKLSTGSEPTPAQSNSSAASPSSSSDVHYSPACGIMLWDSSASSA